ncbi:hypothetical protein BV20DRAFT_854283 [Pilatotrama ljubarskyi]|nr:hypothetical protein BV20DRAFT_854283 [Pilatotrama ljubarskyi]
MLMSSLDSSIHFFLQHKKETLLLLQSRWRTPLVSSVRFDACAREAILVAQSLSGGVEAPPAVTWIQIPIQEEADIGGRGESDESVHTDVFLACDTLEELYEDDFDLPAVPLNAIATAPASSPLERPLRSPSCQSDPGPEMIIERALYLISLNPVR